MAQPFDPAAVAAAREGGNGQRKIALWQLIVALLGLCVVFGGIVWALATELGSSRTDVKVLERSRVEQAAQISNLTRRQEIDEERIGKLERGVDIQDTRNTAMERQHSGIYEAIERLRAAQKR